MSVDSVVAGPRRRTPRAGWGWLLLTAASRSYLAFLGTLAACALFPLLLGLSGAVVQSGSMRPLIDPGDVVLTQALPAGAPTPMGRVVIFPAPVGSARPGTELHRLVAVNADGSLVTAGDANADSDSSSLSRSDILGQGRLLVPWVGLPAFWAQGGAYPQLGAWAVLTLLALTVSVLGSGDRRRPPPPSDDLPLSELFPEAPQEATAPVGTRARHGTSVLARARSALRPTAMLLGPLLIALALTLPPLGTTAAAFSGGSGSMGNSWATATWATHLAFAANPSGSTGGVAFPIQPVVAVRDGTGVTVTSSSAAVTLSLATPAGAALTCASNPVTAVEGVATFTGCAIDKKGTYTLRATASALTSASSTSLTITVGPATQLGFTVNPSTTAVSTSFAAQPKVAIQDAGGNTVTNTSASVTLTITPPAPGATLSCQRNPRSTSSGVANFSSCKINKAGTYTLTAKASSLTSTVSTTFSIFGTATRLAFTTNPADSTGGIAFPTQPVVAIQDANGTTTTGTNAVTLAITTPAGATLTCTTNPRTATAGLATFAGCRIDRPGTYTLTATASGLTTAVSASVSITPGPATKLAFTTNPSGSTSATAFATQPVVTVQDAGGNIVAGSSAAVSLAITTPAGATLTCTANPATAVAGVAAFTGCRIDKKGTYTLTATATGQTAAVSASLTITVGPATTLAFTTNPTGATGGTALATQPVVTIQDAGGNTVTTATSPVTLAITTPAGATLTCTTNPKTAVAGVATFTGCKIDKAGTYTLTATASGLTAALSPSLTITVGPANKLAFSTNPSGATGGTALATQPVVTIQDAGGNPVTSGTNAVTLAITTPAGATLTCATNPRTAVAGVAAFTGCKIDKAGTYTLTATATGLASAVSTTLTITVGPASQLAFTTSPSGAVHGVAFATQPVVTIQDAGGNTLITATSPVALAITTPAGATLTCTTNPKTAVAGVAPFTGCKIDKAGTYTLTATATGLPTAVSGSLTIT